MNGRAGKNRGPGPVPDRWLRCPRKSVSLLINKFLVFKTPLNHRFDDQIPDEYRFPVDFVFNSMKSYKVKVGLWIDLTNTSRFYDKKEIEDNDCKYLKLQCKGHGETPTDDQTKAFIQVCEKFIRLNPLEIIGIHCTHGFNRSGFLLTSYLVESLDWGLEAAIAEFAKIRPPGIYKKDYLKELYKRYDDEQYTPEPPPLPDWCFDYDDSIGDNPDDGDFDDDDNNSQFSGQKRKGDGNDSDKTEKKRKREFMKSNPTFMPGVKGVEPVSQPLLGVIQRKVQDMCEWGGSGFPGSQPVSMDISNMKLLSERPYRVSWKADGVRYLMYIQGKNEIFCIDRDNCVFKVKNLSFPFKKDLNVALKDTLLDGEMVIDKVNGEDVPRYLVYDVITMLEYPIKNRPFFPDRYQAIAQEITEPRYEAMRRGVINKLSEPFSIRPKEFCDVRDASKFLSEKFCKSLSHEPDGLIFQPAKDPYIAGRCTEVLKWKPASMNSVDFKLKIKMEGGVGIVPKKIGELYLGGMDRPFAKLTNVKKIQHLDNKIIECTYDNNKWVYMRERTDKSFPNSYDTAIGVCKSIKNPVTKDILLRYIDSHRYTEPHRFDPMPPPGAPAPRSRRPHHD